MQLMEMARTSPIAVPPDAGVEETQAEPFDVKTFPAVPGEVRPVPPFAAGKVPVTPVVRLMLVTVLLAPLIVLFVSVTVLDAVKTFVGVMMLDKTVMFYSG
jgi:hypothetical protein